MRKYYRQTGVRERVTSLMVRWLAPALALAPLLLASCGDTVTTITPEGADGLPFQVIADEEAWPGGEYTFKNGFPPRYVVITSQAGLDDLSEMGLPQLSLPIDFSKRAVLGIAVTDNADRGCWGSVASVARIGTRIDVVLSSGPSACSTEAGGRTIFLELPAFAVPPSEVTFEGRAAKEGFDT